MDLKELISALPSDSRAQFMNLPRDSGRVVMTRLQELLEQYNRAQMAQEQSRELVSSSHGLPQSLEILKPLLPGNSYSNKSGPLRGDWLKLEISSQRESNQEGIGCLSLGVAVGLFFFDFPLLGFAAVCYFIYAIQQRIAMDDFLLADLNERVVYTYSNQNGGELEELIQLNQVVCLALDAKRESNKNTVYYRHRIMIVTSNATTIPVTDYVNRAFLEAIEFGTVLGKSLQVPFHHGENDSDFLTVGLNAAGEVDIKFY